jgi:hypothetical protein
MEVFKIGAANYNPQAVLFYWISLTTGLCKGAGITQVCIVTRLAGRLRNRASTLGSRNWCQRWDSIRVTETAVDRYIVTSNKTPADHLRRVIANQ